MNSSAALARARPALEARAGALALKPFPDALVTDLCLPLARALARRVERLPGCPLVGIAGAQGTGKSTVCALVEVLLEEGFGLRALTVSLDDAYLPRAARQTLSRTVHPLLATRGVPGTHDVAALHDALSRLRAGERVALPRFDKASDDRSAEPRVCEGPLALVLLEGWCVGARPQANEALAQPVNALERDEDADTTFRRYVNAQLAGPYASLFRTLDLLIFLAAPDMPSVHAFRAEQERKLRSAGGRGAGVMDGERLTRFVQHFERLTLHMLATTPAHADIVVRLDGARDVLAVEGRAHARADLLGP